MDFYFAPVEKSHQKKEKARARALRQTLWWRQQLGKGYCHYCEKKFSPKQLTMDHKIPIVRGGVSSKKNVVVCCHPCNQEKKYYLPGEIGLHKSLFEQDFIKPMEPLE